MFQRHDVLVPNTLIGDGNPPATCYLIKGGQHVEASHVMDIFAPVSFSCAIISTFRTALRELRKAPSVMETASC